jgi:large subunit ribosomal protein L24
MKILKGDTVKIISGKDRGKTGKVLHALPSTNRIVIDGLNLIKKTSRPKQQGEKGQTVMVPRPLAAAKTMVVCSSCKEPTRVGYRRDGSGKIRYCKKCKAKL